MNPRMDNMTDCQWEGQHPSSGLRNHEEIQKYPRKTRAGDLHRVPFIIWCIFKELYFHECLPWKNNLMTLNCLWNQQKTTKQAAPFSVTWGDGESSSRLPRSKVFPGDVYDSPADSPWLAQHLVRLTVQGGISLGSHLGYLLERACLQLETLSKDQ